MWSHTPWQERVALVRKAADLMDQRIFEMGAVVAMEVGKNRMEALGDVAETADLFRYACDSMEKNNGFVVEMGRDPLVGFQATNVSVLRPYGVWLVISPFNFPAALTGGPAGAALVAGNTMVMKPATDTPWTARLIAECLRDAGLPDGRVQLRHRPGQHARPGADRQPRGGRGHLYRLLRRGHEDLPRFRPRAAGSARPSSSWAARTRPSSRATPTSKTPPSGITRSAFGLQGQKCSACSRVFVEEPVYDELVARLVDADQQAEVIGDPTERSVYLGPVVNRSSYHDYQHFAEDLQQNGTILTGGKVLTEGEPGATATSAPPPWSPTCPPSTRSGSTKCSCRSPPSRR